MITTSGLNRTRAAGRAYHLPLITLLALLLSACGGGGGGADNGATAQTTSEPLTLFTSAEVTSQSSQQFEASVGGSLEHQGAILTVPAGALAQSVQLTLAATTLPSRSLEAGNFALAGRQPISTAGYIIRADQTVQLNAPLRLRIPIDSALIPAQTPASAIEIATDTSGHLIAQGSPSLIDLAQGYVELELAVDTLYDADNHTLFGPPQGYMIPLAAVLVAGGVELLNPIMATVKTALNSAQHELTSAHFQLYHSDQISAADANQLLADLERGYDLLVGQLGFNWPNWFNPDDRYTFVVGDVSSYADRLATLFSDSRRVTVPPGYTLPGSALFEGASFIDVFRDQSKRRVTIAHELFHSLQYGSVGRSVLGNLGEKSFNPQSLWLFEGSAAAMGGRMIVGNGSSPARDPDIEFRIPENHSLYDSSDPVIPQDVAQDFFFFLERHLGRLDFYRPAFESLDFGVVPFPLSDTERAARALDSALLDITLGTFGLENAWSAFVHDYVIDNSGLYGSAANLVFDLAVAADGSESSLSSALPPLRYSLIRFKVPGFSKDGGGNIIPAQPTDLELRYRVDAGFGFGLLQIEFADQLSPQAALLEPGVATSAEERVYRIPNIRAERITFFHLLATNSSMLKSDDLSLQVTARLVESESVAFALGFSFINFDGSTGPSQAKPQADPADADIQLSGERPFPQLSWGRPSTALALLDLTNSLTDPNTQPRTLYCIRATEDGQFNDIPFNGPITYGDYGIANTEPCSGAESPSPALVIGRTYQLIVDDANGARSASILFVLE